MVDIKYIIIIIIHGIFQQTSYRYYFNSNALILQ